MMRRSSSMQERKRALATLLKARLAFLVAGKLVSL